MSRHYAALCCAMLRYAHMTAAMAAPADSRCRVSRGPRLPRPTIEPPLARDYSALLGLAHKSGVQSNMASFLCASKLSYVDFEIIFDRFLNPVNLRKMCLYSSWISPEIETIRY